MESSGLGIVRRSSKRLSHRYLLPLVAALTLLAACNNNDVRDITVSDRMLWAEDYPPQGRTIIVGFRY